MAVINIFAPKLRVAASKRRGGADAKSKGFRPDIQGLRAIAVLSVIADHLFHWPTGGFIGVDVFFVISGFLITGLLLREYERTGHISFVDFYRRRVKRILPASLLVLMVTLAASFLVFSHTRFTSVVWDTVWASLFVANWRFASVGTDYFQSDGPTSPIQHFWSLAVEEQFYFVWPWVMLLVFVVLSRMKLQTAARQVAGALLATICLASFAWAMYETAAGPTMAYFSTLSRTWELGIGALIAVAAPALTRIPRALRPFLAWTGLAGILASFFLINSASPFPAPSAALPVLATAMVIIAGTGGKALRMWPLTNPASRYIGDVSYSLYLWHFPVIILVGAMADLSDPKTTGLVVVLMLALSAYSFHLLEDPIRKGIIYWPKRKNRKAAPPITLGYKVAALSLLGAVSIGTAVASLAVPATPQNASVIKLEQAALAPAANEPAYGPAVSALQAEIRKSLAAPTWPTLSPTVDDAIQNEHYPSRVWECGSVDSRSEEECTWGDRNAPKTAVIIGDSISLKWVAPLITIYGQGEWRLRVLSRFGCPYTDAEKLFTDGLGQTCADRKALAIDRINAEKPDIVYIANTSVLPASKATNQIMSRQEWHDGLASFVGKIKGAAKVAVISAPPASKDIKECYTPRSQPTDCVSEVTGKWYEISDVEKRTISAVNGVYLDTKALFCTSQDLCPPFVGDILVKRDLTHLTREYSDKIEPGLKELIVSAGLPG